MLFNNALRRSRSSTPLQRLRIMAQHLATNGASANTNGTSSSSHGVSLDALPKSNVFTSNLPADERFPTPAKSHAASREELGPALVKGALYTFVRPEPKEETELVGVSKQAMRDIGLREGEEQTQAFKDLVAGNKIFWDPDTQEGIYPWAQCYGGWQFGSWAGQLGDGRAISLFESTNPDTKTRYEIQLKGAGRTPYSRFADGKAVVRSSVREFVVSEALHALGIPTTRALSLTLTPKTQVARERMEPGAIVCRFAPSWLRIGTFDILRARGDRRLIRRLSDYLAEHVLGEWEQPPSDGLPEQPADTAEQTSEANGEKPEIESPLHLNRYAQLYRQVCRANAKTVAAWQAYGFMNGVLNTDNTSLLGLSLDFGPFAFIDNFDPSFTPNHDDHALRYAYRNQPSIIWWNLVRLGESLGELCGAGPKVDDTAFIDTGVSEAWAPEVIARAEAIIRGAGHEFQQVFLAEYKRLMTRRLGLTTTKDTDFAQLYSALLDTLEALELDFHHFFRRLSFVPLAALATLDARTERAGVFFHAEGATGVGVNDSTARARVAAWLESYRARALEDWGAGEEADAKRLAAMQQVNPHFVPRGWVLEEVIRRVEKEGDREVLGTVMRMVAEPFRESWDGREEEERWCGEVPKDKRGGMCSCSS